MIIRKANIEDIPQLIPLMAQLGYPPELEFMQNRFADFISNNGYGVAVAEQDNKIVGWIAWSKSILFILPPLFPYYFLINFTCICFMINLSSFLFTTSNSHTITGLANHSTPIIPSLFLFFYVFSFFKTSKKK